MMQVCSLPPRSVCWGSCALAGEIDRLGPAADLDRLLCALKPVPSGRCPVVWSPPPDVRRGLAGATMVVLPQLVSIGRVVMDGKGYERPNFAKA